jgi:hypothetical protein
MNVRGLSDLNRDAGHIIFEVVVVVSRNSLISMQKRNVHSKTMCHDRMLNL